MIFLERVTSSVTYLLPLLLLNLVLNYERVVLPTSKNFHMVAGSVICRVSSPSTVRIATYISGIVNSYGLYGKAILIICFSCLLGLQSSTCRLFVRPDSPFSILTVVEKEVTKSVTVQNMVILIPFYFEHMYPTSMYSSLNSRSLFLSICFLVFNSYRCLNTIGAYLDLDWTSTGKDIPHTLCVMLMSLSD